MAAAGSHLMAAAVDNLYRFAAQRRLKSRSDYAAILRAPNGQSIRAARQFLAVTAVWLSGSTGAVRFGVTVGKRNARRAVDRALIRRVVREACRHHASVFERCVAPSGISVDIALRMKSPLADSQGRALAMAQWRRHLRVEADALLSHVLNKLPLELDMPGDVSQLAEKS